MSRVMYVDAVGGLAGDMLAGALLDLGWPLKELRRLVGLMGLAGVEVEEVRLQRRGLACRRLEVRVKDDQPHRHLSQVLELVRRLPEPVARRAEKVFRLLARAEAAVHGVEPEEIHFHEVGAADALVDVAAFCAGLEYFQVQRLVCSPLPLGRGFVDCAHGRLPLPAPAVVRLLEGKPVLPWPEEGETVTPTGAALVAALAQHFGDLPAMTLERSGLGAGTRQGEAAPNLVRLLLGQEGLERGHAELVEIVCNLDDMNPEDLPLALERLLEAGALDAYATPVYMKKGRPGLELTVLAPPHRARELAGLVLEQTSSLGVRLRPVGRRTLAREVVTLQSPWGPVRVKRARVADGWRYTPEADEVTRIARQTGLAPALVRERLAALWRE